MLGLIVVANPQASPGTPHVPLEDLVGVPVLARAIAGALPTDESVTGVLVVAEGSEGQHARDPRHALCVR
jgi:hypothetical protein